MSCGLVVIFRATSILKARISQKGMKFRKPREEVESKRSDIQRATMMRWISRRIMSRGYRVVVVNSYSHHAQSSGQYRVRKLSAGRRHFSSMDHSFSRSTTAVHQSCTHPDTVQQNPLRLQSPSRYLCNPTSTPNAVPDFE